MSFIQSLLQAPLFSFCKLRLQTKTQKLKLVEVEYKWARNKLDVLISAPTPPPQPARLSLPEVFARLSGKADSWAGQGTSVWEDTRNSLGPGVALALEDGQLDVCDLDSWAETELGCPLANSLPTVWSLPDPQG